MADVAEILSPGLGLTFQDRGRLGWRRFGVPVSGPLDGHAAGWANRLLDNDPEAVVLECLLQGARLSFLHDAWISITGAEVDSNVATWRAVPVRRGTVLHLANNRSGVWSYVAIAGGFQAPRLLGSSSVFARGGLGAALRTGDVLRVKASSFEFKLPPGIAGRTVDRTERRDYMNPPPLKVWPGPHWAHLSPRAQDQLLRDRWKISPQSDRAGYRLAGPILKPHPAEIVSEPVPLGCVQVPENGQPIVVMNDGPTVGGYPQVALLDHSALCWLAQCRPGQHVRFDRTDGSGNGRSALSNRS